MTRKNQRESAHWLTAAAACVRRFGLRMAAAEALRPVHTTPAGLREYLTGSLTTALAGEGARQAAEQVVHALEASTSVARTFCTLSTRGERSRRRCGAAARP